MRVFPIKSTFSEKGHNFENHFGQNIWTSHINLVNDKQDYTNVQILDRKNR